MSRWAQIVSEKLEPLWIMIRQTVIEGKYIQIDETTVDIRPFVLGRKAWLFSGSPEGAKANAILYSMITTARAADWEPFAYLNHVFDHLPKATSEGALRALLPAEKPSLAT